MSKIAEAWSALLTLPQRQQEIAAEAILDFADDDGSLSLTTEQVAEVERRLADPQATFLTLAEVRARFNRRSP